MTRRKEHYWYVTVREPLPGKGEDEWRETTAWFHRKQGAYALFQVFNRMNACACMGDEGDAPLYTTAKWRETEGAAIKRKENCQ